MDLNLLNTANRLLLNQLRLPRLARPLLLRLNCLKPRPKPIDHSRTELRRLPVQKGQLKFEVQLLQQIFQIKIGTVALCKVTPSAVIYL
ncbi:hypothetical protein OUZ56_017060 [Daphnia magna]|uniref:Uncharacterized protein n=1 Tax=Daphnia magna TaxID=35525 RepID=A0ABR0AS45_9CRUS|nr:hypothetical protein OUZ56_017060 [Daphnia magna]